ncbi:MopE-related protein [Nitrospina watsonii]|uniref:Carboxypeptidase regulatory-like domain-containing protein n=1 Tax=Nitrospina watsonii TaxID=1323948 RepID=A0ABN8W6J8_9BACT|nr:MopE-related protein [Nitrospina watsonii]CAI2719261.1 conserved exported protein of unknown function [Nitrospina watsonii]
MSRNTILAVAMFALLGFMTSPAAASELSVEFSAMSNHSDSGQIEGKVVSCSGKYNPQGTIVHIPGVSVSTKLPPDGAFTLLFVPEGTYNLVFERAGKTFRSINGIEVKSSKKTILGPVQICPDLDGDGYAVTADIDDENAATYPGAKEICDRVDNNGNGEIDEGCSYRKCPKGGKFCMSNWNNINPWLRGQIKTQSWDSSDSRLPKAIFFQAGQ